MIFDTPFWELLLIGIAAFVAVYSLVRLMQVYRERLIHETRLLLEKRTKRNAGKDKKEKEEDEESDSKAA